MDAFFHPVYTIICPSEKPLDIKDHEEVLSVRPLAGGLVEYTVVSRKVSAA